MSDEWTTPASDAIDIKKDEPDNKGVYPEYVGTYEDSISFPSNFDPTKKSYVYKFVDPEGSPFSVFGFTSFNRFMEATPKGSLVKFRYTGKKKSKKGFDVNTCTVQYKKSTAKAAVDGVTVVEDDDLPF